MQQKESHGNDLFCFKFVGLKIFNVSVSKYLKEFETK